MRTPKYCKHCNTEIPVIKKWDSKKKFCNLSCSASFNMKEKAHRPLTEEHRQKLAELALNRFKMNNKDNIGKPLSISSLLQTSSRTVQKIIKRMGFGCSRCGWNEAACDIHHIYGRQIPDADNHNNLTLLCPNCHRLCHAKKIPKEELKNFTELFGNEWKNHYYK